MGFILLDGAVVDGGEFGPDSFQIITNSRSYFFKTEDALATPVWMHMCRQSVIDSVRI